MNPAKVFESNKPCWKGHTTRYIRGKQPCVICSNERGRKKYVPHPLPRVVKPVRIPVPTNTPLATTAHSQGLKTFTGLPCSKGHTLHRPYIQKGKVRSECVECKKTIGRANWEKKKSLGIKSHQPTKKALEAKARGEKYYVSAPCKHGHVLRYVSTNGCVGCQKRSSQAWSKAHPVEFYKIQLRYITKRLATQPTNVFYNQMKQLAEKKIRSN